MSLVPALGSAQDVEPDELGFVIGTPEVLEPAEGARSVVIYGNPSEPGMYVMPPCDRPDRPGARQLRRDGAVETP